MNNADSKGLVSSKEGVAKIDNDLSEKMDLELSQKTDRMCMNGEERGDIQGIRPAQWWDGTGHGMLGESGGSLSTAENLCFILPAPSLCLTYAL